MKAEDLRIGNYIEYCGKIVKCTINTIYAISKTTSPTKVYLPIPLTEEWLIDFKLEMEGRYTYLFGNIRFSYYADGYLYEQIIIPGSGQTLQYGKRIEFVHNFQNRVHSLTGKELTK